MQLSLAGVSVMLAMPVNRDLPWQTARSLAETASILTARGIEYEMQFVVGSSIIHKSRSNLARIFMKGTASRLFWIDSDMAWNAVDFVRLLSFSTVMNVVGATYPAKREPNIEFLMDVPTGPVKTNEYGCIPVNGMGLGFTVVRREVIEALSKLAPMIKDDDGDDVPMIFRTEIENEVFRGEDMCFFADCRKLGAGVWCDPSITLGHVGGKEYRGALKDAMKRAV